MCGEIVAFGSAAAMNHSSLLKYDTTSLISILPDKSNATVSHTKAHESKADPSLSF